MTEVERSDRRTMTAGFSASPQLASPPSLADPGVFAAPIIRSVPHGGSTSGKRRFGHDGDSMPTSRVGLANHDRHSRSFLSVVRAGPEWRRCRRGRGSRGRAASTTSRGGAGPARPLEALYWHLRPTSSPRTATRSVIAPDRERTLARIAPAIGGKDSPCTVPQFHKGVLVTELGIGVLRGQKRDLDIVKRLALLVDHAAADGTGERYGIKRGDSRSRRARPSPGR